MLADVAVRVFEDFQHVSPHRIIFSAIIFNGEMTAVPPLKIVLGFPGVFDIGDLTVEERLSLRRVGGMRFRVLEVRAGVR